MAGVRAALRYTLRHSTGRIDDMKILKWLGFTVGGLIVLLVVGIAILTATFDPNKYKADITKLVKENKNRTLAIPGNIALKVFPKLGLDLGQVTLSEFGSDTQFAKLERVKLYVELMPLLKRDLIVDKIEIDGLAANIIKGKDGKFNFDDLLSKDDTQQQQVKFDVEGVRLTGASVTYRDDLTGQTAKLDQMNLTTGRIADKVPGKIDLSAKVEGTKPAVNAQLNVAGGILFDLEKKQYAFTSLEAKVLGGVRTPTEKGKAGMDLAGLDAKLSAGDLKVDGATFAIAAQKLALEAKGALDKQPFEIKLASPKLTANGKTGAIAAEKIALEAKGRHGNESGTVKLDAAKFDADMDSHRIAVEGLTANGSGAMPGILLNDFKARAPKLLINLAGGQIALDGVTLSATGKRGDDAFDVKVDAPRLAVGRDSATGETITGTVKLAGKDVVDLKFNLGDVKGSAKALTVGRVALEIAQAKFGDTSLSGSVNTALTANLEARQFNLPRIAADIAAANPQMPMKSVKLPITGSARADLAKETASVDLAVKFDESAIQAKAGVTRFKNSAINFDVIVDRLNVDKYLPPRDPNKPKTNEPEKPFDLSALKTLNATGTIKVGHLQISNMKATNVSLAIKAAGGKVEVNPVNAGLYQGTLAGNARIDANTSSFAAKQSLRDVNMNPLMKDALNKDVLEGRGNVDIDITTAGNTATALKKNLNGTTVTTMRDGAYKGMNLAKSFREWKAMAQLNKNKVQEAKKDEKTDFTEFKTVTTIKSGVATVQELNASSPFLRVAPSKRQASTVDIGNDSLNMLLDATVVGSPKGQDSEFNGLKGVTIPVALYGPFSEMKYDIKWGEIGAAILKQAAEGKLDKVKESAQDKIRERLGLKKPESAQAPAPAPSQAPAQQQPPPQSAQDKAKEKLRGLLGR